MSREQARLAKRLEKIQSKNATEYNKSIILNYSNVLDRQKTPKLYRLYKPDYAGNALL